MLANMEERKITNGDIDLLIAEIDKSLKELNSIHVSCQDIRKDLVRIAQALDEKFNISN